MRQGRVRGRLPGRWAAAACGVLLAAACAPVPIPEGWVRVGAYDSDLATAPSAAAVRTSHFDVDERGRPVGLAGPRVRIELPSTIPTRIGVLTLRSADEMPNPLRLPGPTPDGSFVYRAGTPESAMANAFVWATRTIDAAERWVGHRVEWGDGGRLSVVPCACAVDAELAWYNWESRRVYLGASARLSLDMARSPDTVVHECTHAVVAALKPGCRAGVAAALNEGLADAASFLVALHDAQVLRRVLAGTGGELRLARELTRFGEAPGERGSREPICHREIGGLVTAADCRIRRDDAVGPPGVFAEPGRWRDPHRIGQVISGALWELLVLVYERSVLAGCTPAASAERARDTVGTLMLRALAFVGEHRVSLRDYGCALALADALCGGSANRAEIATVLERRGLVDGPADLEGELSRRRALVPAFSLDPRVSEESALLAAVEELEWLLVEAARAQPREGLDEPAPLPFLRHSGIGCIEEDIPADALSIHSDVTTADGLRVLRLAYRVRPEAKAGTEWTARPALFGPPEPEPSFEGYLSLVFDASGLLLDLHVDRPLE